MMLCVMAVWAATALATTSPVAGTNPGVMLGLSNAGLDYARQVFVPILLNDIQHVHIPDISGDVDTPVGHVSYSISDVSISSVSLGGSAADFTKSGIALSLSNGALKGSANWHYREDHWPHVSDHGEVDISLSDFSISTTIDAVTDSKTHAPQLSLASCSFNIGSVDVHFHGGASWLYNIFKSLIEKAVKDALGKELCPIVTKELGPVNAALEKLPMSVSLDHGISLSYALISNPILTSDFLISPHSGAFVPKQSSSPCPFSPQPVQYPSSLPRMLYVWVTEFEPEDAAWAYQQAGALDFLINASNLPASSPIKLNTSTFCDITTRSLCTLYPNKAMSIGLVARAPAPVDVAITPAGINATLYFDLHFSVVEPNGTVIPVFILNSTTYADATVKCNTTANGVAAVFFNVAWLRDTIALAKSYIGNFSPLALDAIVALAIQGFVLPEINKAGAKGVPIPTVDGVRTVNPQVVLGDGVVRIDADVHYNG